MNRPDSQARRATVDDLPRLRPLWSRSRFRTEELEKRVTEFQVLEDGERNLIGCLGLRVEGTHGLVHSQTFRDDDAATVEHRRLLWERMQTVARNRGLARLWIAEDSPFWRDQGFEPPDEPSLGKRLGLFEAAGSSGLTLKLRDEVTIPLDLEAEFDLFKQSQRDQSEQALRQAQIFRYASWVLIALACAGILYLAWYSVRHLPAR